MATIRLYEYRDRQISTPAPEVNEHGDAISNVVVFDEDGVAEVTEVQADYLLGTFRGAERVKEEKPKPRAKAAPKGVKKDAEAREEVPEASKATFAR